MNGVFCFLLIIAVIALFWISMKSVSTQHRSNQRTQQNNANYEYYRIFQITGANNGLPPIRNPKQAIQHNRKSEISTAKLPSYIRRTGNIYDFPHCPKCWSKNRKGETQTVFWRSDAKCFQCIRGHRFRKNGTIIA